MAVGMLPTFALEGLRYAASSLSFNKVDKNSIWGGMARSSCLAIARLWVFRYSCHRRHQPLLTGKSSGPKPWRLLAIT